MSDCKYDEVDEEEEWLAEWFDILLVERGPRHLS